VGDGTKAREGLFVWNRCNSGALHLTFRGQHCLAQSLEDYMPGSASMNRDRISLTRFAEGDLERSGEDEKHALLPGENPAGNARALAKKQRRHQGDLTLIRTRYEERSIQEK